MTVKKKPKLLWANSYCLLDTSSGASISVRQILLELIKRGFEIDIVGATIFDTDKGVEGLGSLWEKIKTADASVINVPDGPLVHRLIKTKENTRDRQTLSEANRFINLYQSRLDAFSPDLVFFYGGNAIDFLIPGEARVRGIPSASYLVNANYQGKRWCRDVDLIVTDTNATANFYKETQGFKPVPIGKFIDPAKVISKSHERKNLTFINPSYAKGAGIVCQLAIVLERLRPDIDIEVVESRGDWTSVVKDVSKSFFGKERNSLSNVTLTPNTKNIAEVYKRSRVLIAPSLWWESGSRVLAEAMLNGIPTIVTNKGGSPEIVGEGGITIELPQECFNHPYDRLPTAEYLTPIIEIIENLWDNEGAYLNLMTKAIKKGMEHKIEISGSKVEEEFLKVIKQNSTRIERNTALKNVHKHNIIEERITFGLTAEEKSKTENKKLIDEKNVNPKITQHIFLASKQQKLSPINNFAFFWVGTDIQMPSTFVESIRLLYGKSANIIQISDEDTHEVAGVSSVSRSVLSTDIMLARLEACSKLENISDPIAFYDVDTLFIDKISAPSALNGRTCILRREHDFNLNHNFPEYYPEFIGKSTSEVMPYLAGCIITANPKKLFSALLLKCQKLPNRFHRWYGDQVALKMLALENPKMFIEIEEKIYLKTFDKVLNQETFDSLKSQNTANIHFKGVSEKKFLYKSMANLKSFRHKIDEK